MAKLKVLVVEDDIDTQLFLELLLGKYYHLVMCLNDVECYAGMRNNDIRLIVMDVALKGSMDGLQITRELKNSDQYKHIPIVCLSAHVLENDKRLAYEAGVDVFLGKPVSNEKLLSTLDDFILR